MKPTVPKQKRKVDRLRCDQCGHECSQGEFVRGLNLCDHLTLDALAVTQLQWKKGMLFSGNPPSRQFFQNDSLPCPRCQGLMVPEKFIDLENNAQCEGRRCLLCGNVWDRVIANHRLSGTGKLVSQPSVRTIRPMSVHGVSNQDDARERR
jgi:hypothetical protein